MDETKLISTVFKRFCNIMELVACESIQTVDDYTKWLDTKAQLTFGRNAAKNFSIINNCIYWAHLGYNIGSEEGKHRPVLVTRTSFKSPICTIIPLTTQRLNDGYWYHVDLEKMDSTALVEQMRIIDKRRIDRPKRKNGKVLTISQKDWTSINAQIIAVYELKPLKQ
ncbi:MAG: type II toxin-antitoxin system PemK/MazF family toxin [Defluviitaleaceae bacterium]|nr:type II toxin-antitoxin system PemK/MazF family toxin [Defluviitaleaceae bacterium]MCL2261880.1 type II toxin-antitoxin system PemK/MazF family toxin [Defluviitaleaceae bacterium]